MRQLICLIGPDGTGKSTQSHLLIKELRDRNIDCAYRWARFAHFFSMPLMILARLMGKSEMITLASGRRIGYHYYSNSRLLLKLYPILLYLDTWLLIWLKIRLPNAFNKKIIICDRFAHDTLVDLMISTNNYGLIEEEIGRKYLSLVPSTALVLMLIADEKTLRSRRDDIENDRTIGIKFKLYSTLGEKLNLPTVESIYSIDETNRRILDIVLERINLDAESR